VAENGKTLVEPSDDLLQRNHRHPRRGEFQGERQSVKAPADRRNIGSLSTRELSIVCGEPSAILEKLDRFALSRTIGLRQGEWLKPPDAFTV